MGDCARENADQLGAVFVIPSEVEESLTVSLSRNIGQTSHRANNCA